MEITTYGAMPNVRRYLDAQWLLALIDSEPVIADRDKCLNWIQHGLRYGYPVCCIGEFLTTIHDATLEPRKLDGTGYIPCTCCNEKFSEAELIKTINERRHPDEPSFDRNS